MKHHEPINQQEEEEMAGMKHHEPINQQEEEEMAGMEHHEPINQQEEEEMAGMKHHEPINQQEEEEMAGMEHHESINQQEEEEMAGMEHHEPINQQEEEEMGEFYYGVVYPSEVVCPSKEEVEIMEHRILKLIEDFGRGLTFIELLEINNFNGEFSLGVSLNALGFDLGEFVLPIWNSCSMPAIHALINLLNIEAIDFVFINDPYAAWILYYSEIESTCQFRFKNEHPNPFETGWMAMLINKGANYETYCEVCLNG